MTRRKSNPSTPDPAAAGELAALAVLFVAWAAAGRKTRRRMAKALRQLDADWSRPDESDPAGAALQASARRFARPAALLLSPAAPRPPIPRP